MLQNLAIEKQFKFFLLGANNGGLASPCSVHSGVEDVPDVFVVEADIEN